MPRFLLLFMMTAFAFGCTTELTHQYIDATGNAAPGFPYYLPKQKFTLNVTYELVNCPDINGMIPGQALTLDISQTATITETSEADESEYYLVTYEDLNSALKTSSFTATTYDNKTLHTLGAQVEDRSAAVIKSSVGTAISIAKMVMQIPAAAVLPQICKPEVYAALKTIKDDRAKLLGGTLDDKGATSVTASMTAAKTTLRIQRQLSFSPNWTHLSLKSTLNPGDLHAWLPDNYPSFIGNQAEFNKSVTTEIVATPAAGIQPSARPDTTFHEGVVFRDPAPATIKACASSCAENSDRPLASVDTQLGQLGRYMTLTLKNRAFDKNNLSIDFAANGRLNSMTFASESRLEKAAGALQDTSTQAAGLVDKRRAADQAAAELAAGAQLKSIKAQTELLNAQSDRIDAQNRLTKLGGE